MKTLGIIGGIGPEATVIYYRSLISHLRERTGNQSYPNIILNSIDLTRMLALIEANEPGRLIEYLVAELSRLAAAGATFGLFASNTPHIVFDEIQRQSPIPLLSIVEATRDAALRAGSKKLGLFGTRYTMEGTFYCDVFSKVGIDLFPPDKTEQELIHARYFDELVHGIVRPETRLRLLGTVDRMKNADHIDGLILGGTELSLIFDEETAAGVRVFDTTRIHIAAAIDYLVS